MSDIITDDGVYEPVEDELRIAISYLLRLRERMGITDETQLEGSLEDYKRNNKTILKYALEIYRVWGALYPTERYDFIENSKYELDVERPVKQAIKSGGYSPTSYPIRLERLYSILIPSVKIQDKRFWKALFYQIPELRRSNYA